jgi:hypothetical protein
MNQSEAEKRKGVGLWAVRQVLGALLVLAASFAASGRFDWFWGWLLFGIIVVQFLVTLLFLVPRNPGLYAERYKAQKGTKGWDMPLAVLVAYGPLYILIVGGLAARWEWSPL